MSVLVIFESYFGNNELIAQAVAAALRESIGNGEITVLSVDEAPDTVPTETSLLVVGGPTHALTMSTSLTRSAAQSAQGKPSARGIRDWLQQVELDAGTKVAVYGTQSSKVSGSAARAAAKLLRKRGVTVVSRADFIVTAQEGPLAAGEADRASAWAQSLINH